MKKVIKYRCCYCGTIKKFPDANPCLDCGAFWHYLEPIEVEEEEQKRPTKRKGRTPPKK
jgi:hypothetical protein